jgi:hypothetical protein
MSTPRPFLTYLTVFKSRLGIANMAVPMTGFQHQPSPLVMRNLRKILEEREQLPLNHDFDWVFEYLTEKKIVTGSRKRGTRYYGYSLARKGQDWEVISGRETKDSLPVYTTDLWMADPRVPSTIGVPTPDNVNEALELVYQLQIISTRTNSWTSAGNLLSSLRGAWSPDEVDLTNPFIIRAEGICLLRQVLREDGLIIRPLLQKICEHESEIFTRDSISHGFLGIVQSAVYDVKRLSFQPPLVREAQEHLALIRKTAQRLESPKHTRGKTPGSRGPGVLEHRVAPRLEWLTDVGVLTKSGVPKNSFQYKKTPWAAVLLESLSRNPAIDADEASLDQWYSNPLWASPREHLKGPTVNHGFSRAYRMMQRRIGPTSLNEVAFLGALFSPEKLAFAEAQSRLIDLAQSTEGATLSGGRYRRGPENIHMTEDALESLS